MYTRFLLMIVSFLVSAASVFAGPVLKEFKIVTPEQFEIQFDSKLNPGQYEVEYFRDIIQITLNDVSVYPAKIYPIRGDEVSKVFVYQYSPKTVRVRLSTVGDAEKFKNRVDLKLVQGKVLAFKLKDPSDGELVANKVENSKLVPPKIDLPVKANAVIPTETSSETSDSVKITAAKPIATGKGIGVKTLWRPFLMLSLILPLFIGFAFVFKKFRNRKIGGWISKVASKGLGKNTKVLEVVANHYLGPKKSIAVIKVQGETLVVGITDESINLISRVSNSDLDPDQILDETERSVEGIFAPSATGNASNPFPGGSSNSAMISQTVPKMAVPSRSNHFRDEIRKKLEGFKQL